MCDKPTPEQAAILLKCAGKYGRYWKDQITNLWAAGWYPRWATHDECAALRQVRNDLGPEWLDKVTVRQLYGWAVPATK